MAELTGHNDSAAGIMVLVICIDTAVSMHIALCI